MGWKGVSKANLRKTPRSGAENIACAVAVAVADTAADTAAGTAAAAAAAADDDDDLKDSQC